MPSAPYRGLFTNPPTLLQASPGAVTGTTIALLWPMSAATAPQTLIPANTTTPNQRFIVRAGGIISTPASTTTIIVTPIWGTTTGGTSLGASLTYDMPLSLSNANWNLELTVAVRSLSYAATSTTVVCYGSLNLPGVASATSSTPTTVNFGSNGTVSVDTTTAQGLVACVTLSNASDSMTTQDVFMEALL